MRLRELVTAVVATLLLATATHAQATTPCDVVLAVHNLHADGTLRTRPPVKRTGSTTVVLHASSNRTDTDFTAKLIDVSPSSDAWPGGLDMTLTDAIVRGRYRATRDHAVMLTPGRVYPFTIEPFPTANVSRTGHRIRVDISSSNFPRFGVTPITGEPLGRNRRMVTAEYTVHHGAMHPSHVVLPIAPARP